MQLLRVLLFPFSLIYSFILYVRNKCYDWNWFDTITFDEIKTISVGNLSVGGTGKTPHVEYLIRLFDSKKKAILSRGYGRKTEGVLLAIAQSTPVEIGDEPAQYVSKFYPKTKIGVAEKRVEGAKELIENYPELDMLILDDAFQHRAIGRDFDLLLTDYNNLFYKDFVLPSGYLREARAGANRSTAVVVSKCPTDLSYNQKEKIEIHIRNYTAAPVFFSRIKYGEMISINGVISKVKEVVLLTGIANSLELKKHIEKTYNLIKHFDLADHHQFSQEEIDEIRKELGDNLIITTEKDIVKLKQLNLNSLNIAYLPIEIEFFDKEFDTFVLSKINEN